MSRSTFGILGVVAIVLLALGAASYVVVREYYVDSVDAVGTSTTKAVTSATPADSSTDTSPSTSSAQSTSQTEAPTEDAESTDSGYSATDTSYVDATKSISITKVTTGEGSDTVTYYVADVELTSATDLQAAFSGGEFDSRETEDTSDIAADNNAILAINGDYYSAMSDGVVIRNGVLYRNIPARTGLALFEDGSMAVYEETEVSADQLLADGVWNTYTFGPALLVEGDIPDGIDTYEAVANPRHPIQGTNPRTGIGLISNNHFVLVVVDGRQAGYSKGVTITEFAQIFKDLGCITAYNLDGGGSSTMYFMGEVINNPASRQGQRAISDILFVG
jgi:exopolysaccharide biosynthesis protein